SDVLALLIGLVIFVALGYLIHYRAEVARFIMSRIPQRPINAVGMERYDIPVSAPPIPPQPTTQPQSGMEARSPDIDAENDGWEAPRVSAYGSVEDDIIFLAMRRAGPGQKHRYSANKIAQMVGGNRNQVLALVKKIRSTDPLPIFYDDLLQQIEAE